MADLPKDNKEATVIGNDTHIKGEMSFKKSVRLVGSLEGRVVGEGELHVAEGARCKADVESPAVVVDGAIEGNVTARDNVNGPVEPIAFVDVGPLAGVPTRRLEMWTATTTLGAGDPPTRYEPGMLVMYDAALYECTAANTNQPPPMHPESWRALPLPADDVRVPSGSAYAGLGISAAP